MFERSPGQVPIGSPSWEKGNTWQGWGQDLKLMTAKRQQRGSFTRIPDVPGLFYGGSVKEADTTCTGKPPHRIRGLYKQKIDKVARGEKPSADFIKRFNKKLGSISTQALVRLAKDMNSKDERVANKAATTIAQLFAQNIFDKEKAQESDAGKALGVVAELLKLKIQKDMGADGNEGLPGGVSPPEAGEDSVRH